MLTLTACGGNDTPAESSTQASPTEAASTEAPTPEAPQTPDPTPEATDVALSGASDPDPGETNGGSFYPGFDDERIPNDLVKVSIGEFVDYVYIDAGYGGYRFVFDNVTEEEVKSLEEHFMAEANDASNPENRTYGSRIETDAFYEGGTKIIYYYDWAEVELHYFFKTDLDVYEVWVEFYYLESGSGV